MGQVTTEKVGHTPGPWTAADDRRGVWEIFHDGDMLAQIWKLRLGPGGDLPAEANASLIAAAPDLLVACKALIAWSKGSMDERVSADTEADVLGEVIEAARAAIARAEGSQS